MSDCRSIVSVGIIMLMALLGVCAVGVGEASGLQPMKIGGQKSAPPLFISEEDLDMGNVPPRSKTRKSVRVRNMGDQPVVIVKTTGDCSCTALITDGYATIKAGDDLEMEIEVETRDMGVQTKTVRLICEGFGRPFEAVVRTNITDAVEVNPGGLKALLQPTGIITLKSIDDRAFRVVSVHGDTPQFIGFDPEKDETRSLYRVVYDFSSMPANEMPGIVMIETDHPDAPFVAIRYLKRGATPDQAEANKGNWRPDYDFEYLPEIRAGGASEEIQLRLAKAGRASREQTLTVSSDHEGLAFEVAGVDNQSDPKWMLVTLRITPSPESEGFQAATLGFRLGEERACEVEFFTRVIGG